MSNRLSGAAVPAFVAMAAMTAMAAPTLWSHAGKVIPSQEQTTVKQAGSAPVILAQGRCFNGRCF
ncbi:MAG TPA: hypothetical protein VGH39_07540 [Xanthobacteraceae bacterium]